MLSFVDAVRKSKVVDLTPIYVENSRSTHLFYKSSPGNGKTFMADFLYGLFYQGGPHFTSADRLKSYSSFTNEINVTFLMSKYPNLRRELQQANPNVRLVYLDFNELAVSSSADLIGAYQKLLADTFVPLFMKTSQDKNVISQLEDIWKEAKWESLAYLLKKMGSVFKQPPVLMIDNIDKPFLTLGEKADQAILHQIIAPCLRRNLVLKSFLFGVFDFRDLSNHYAALDVRSFQDEKCMGRMFPKEPRNFEKTDVFYTFHQNKQKTPFVDWNTILRVSPRDLKGPALDILCQFLIQDDVLEVAKHLVQGKEVELSFEHRFSLSTFREFQSPHSDFIGFLSDLGWLRITHVNWMLGLQFYEVAGEPYRRMLSDLLPKPAPQPMSGMLHQFRALSLSDEGHEEEKKNRFNKKKSSEGF